MTRQGGRTCHIAFFISSLSASFRRAPIDQPARPSRPKAAWSPFFLVNNLCTEWQLPNCGKVSSVKPIKKCAAHPVSGNARKEVQPHNNYVICISWIIIFRAGGLESRELLDHRQYSAAD